MTTDSALLPCPLTVEQIEELRERSKNDRAIIVGSEIRMLCEAALRNNRAPSGYVLVPLEPTEEMCKAVAFGSYTSFSYGGDENSFEYISEDNARDIYKAMLAAKP